MSSDNRDDNSEQHSENKWRNHRPSKLTKAVATIIIYLLFVFIDAHDIWPSWPLVGIVVGVIASIAVLYLEAFAVEAISFTVFLTGAAVVLVVGGLFYFIAPRNTPAPTIGWLQPANEPTPPNPCGDRVAGPSIVILGDSAFRPLVPAHNNVVEIGQCAPVFMEQTPNGLAISGDIYSSDGVLLGRLNQNGYKVTGDANLIVEKSGDLSTLVVHDTRGTELLYVRYLNPQAIRLRGIFTCPKPRLATVTITNSGIIMPRNITFDGSCFRALNAIKIN